MGRVHTFTWVNNRGIYYVLVGDLVRIDLGDVLSKEDKWEVKYISTGILEQKPITNTSFIWGKSIPNSFAFEAKNSGKEEIVLYKPRPWVEGSGTFSITIMAI